MRTRAAAYKDSRLLVRHSATRSAIFAVPTHMTLSAPPAEYAVFVLQADGIEITHVEESGGEVVLVQPVLVYLELDGVRILVTLRLIVHRHDSAVDIGAVGSDCGGKIGREGSYAALLRQIRPDQCDGFYWRRHTSLVPVGLLTSNAGTSRF